LLAEGDVIAGKYRIERVLGVGGMGAVVAAANLALGSRVALKIMLPELADSPEFAARFIREARAAASITGEHVVRVFDVSKMDDGTLYMVMELLDGQDLHQVLKARGPLPIDEAVGWLLEACDALAEAHAHGIVHRDLKPSNLFIVEQTGAKGALKVLDFGISKLTGLQAVNDGGPTLTTADSMLGSPYYMSPEQIRNARTVDARADLWSLGVILHKMLTGFLPFESDSMGEHLSMIAADPPAPLRLRRPDAPAELEAIVLRCLEKDASLRFQNIAQLAAALAPFAPPASQRLLDHITALLGPAALAAGSSRATSTPPPPVNRDDPTVTNATSSRPTQRVRSAPPRGRAAAFAASILVLATGIIYFVSASHRPPQSMVASTVAAGITSSPSVDDAAAPSAEPVAPAEIEVRLEIHPVGAIVELDGIKTSGSTLRVPRSGRAHTLVISAVGYETETRSIEARADMVLSLSLRRQESKPGRPVAPVSPARSSPPTPPPAATEASLPPPAKKLKGPVETDL
jgi:serine/threonine-protein kinase